MKLKKTVRAEAAELYRGCFGTAPGTILEAASGGSSRIYLRLLAPAGAPSCVPESVIATYGADHVENKTFCRLAEIFAERAEASGAHYRVPRIYAEAPDRGLYLQEDLGTLSLVDLLEPMGRAADGKPDEECMTDLLRKVLEALLALQTTPEYLWRDVVMNTPFGERRILWDLNYFKYSFLKVTDTVFDEDRLEDDFRAMAADLTGYPGNMGGFMYRDFQSRNIVLDPSAGIPGFIDFQGGMEGPMVYDAVSLLWQVKANLPEDLRRRMLREYVSRLVAIRGGDGRESLDYAMRMAVFRTLQVLGAYGFRGLIEKKTHFIVSIPGALGNLERFVSEGALAPYPELERVCREITRIPKFRVGARSRRLRVQILSFSYKKGYPENITGNGGGYVFDCRWMHNPGRYEKYKPLTGRDREVIDFLESKGEVGKFMENVYGLVGPAVTVYRDRQFTDLQVAFGCTGGRHRSLYCAERLYDFLTEKFSDVEVELIHRERGWRKANY